MGFHYRNHPSPFARLRFPRRRVYTSGMKLGSSISRMFLALWLCTGMALHLAVDHAATLGHAAHHLNETHPVSEALALALTEHDDTLCCYHSPKHHGHDNGVPHAHLTEARLAGSSQRTLSLLHAAVLPLRILEALPQTAPLLPAISVALPADAPSTHNAALRAPPLA